MDELHQRLTFNIRRIAKQRGNTLTHVADFAAVGRSSFWDVLNGGRSPTLRWMGALADGLEVDVVELLKPQPVSSSEE